MWREPSAAATNALVFYNNLFPRLVDAFTLVDFPAGFPVSGIAGRAFTLCFRSCYCRTDAA